MGFLLAFVDKEKHAEALAEKLCQRLDATKADDDAFAKATGDDAQTASRRDLAFCLGRLMLTEKVTRKLAESIALYKDALAGRGRLRGLHGHRREGAKITERHEGGFRRLGGEAPRGS